MKETRKELNALFEKTQSLRNQLHNHPIYSSITSLENLRKFMEIHVFAVWDFMSLLKALQRGITCVEVPWIPREHAGGRLINDIVRDEESDLDPEGKPASHFSIYRSAMCEAGAGMACMDRFLRHLQLGYSIAAALEQSDAPAGAREFVKSTFRIIHSKKLHQVAAAFAFGREDLIPQMFSAIVREMKQSIPGLELFYYYLQRHIELDGDDHGPLAHSLVCELCGDDARLWEEATAAANEALQARIALWNSVTAECSCPLHA